ncbi:MAG: polysaccharide biosynthesis/export family protein [Flavobacteriales bacterium]|nr:polysaccharide biosynthesis/export family protein [Flavobacteriales bacterium]
MNIIRLELSKIIKYIGAFYLVCIFSSCITNKELEYFRTQRDDELVDYKQYDYRLQINDLLSIQISSVSEDKYDFFNKEQTANSQLMVYNPYLYGYLIEKDSTLELPMIGEVNAVGKTLQELEDLIQNSAIVYFKAPVVKVNILNFELDILGEVKSPNRYRIINPKINILDAIATAGDITEIGNRKKVKVIRLTDKDPRVFYLDLRDKNLASNSDFFLQPNDIVYVPPTNKRFYAFKNLPSVMSLGISAFTLYLLINKD